MSPGFADEDLDAAVAAGVIGPEAAEQLRSFVARRRETPHADEETFRLLTGFNDIFVSIALVMVLGALAWIGARSSSGLGAALVAAASWALAEFFTRRRRMALPSLLLLAFFVSAVLACLLSWWPDTSGETQGAGKILVIGALATVSAFLHWRRFHVPITVAAGVVVAVAALTAAIAGSSAGSRAPVVALAGFGLLTFALALRWDLSDPRRRTRRADVAFWLHLAAAPMIVHPAFSLLGLGGVSFLGRIIASPPANADGSVAATIATAVMALAIYLALAAVALVIDRRALMVSSLAYLLFATNAIFRASGALTISFALSGLIVGAGLLLLSAYWSATRRLLLRATPPAWRARLPAA